MTLIGIVHVDEKAGKGLKKTKGRTRDLTWVRGIFLAYTCKPRFSPTPFGLERRRQTRPENISSILPIPIGQVRISHPARDLVNYIIPATCENPDLF